MDAKNNGGPAFPCDSKRYEAEGMSLRDYFAAKAMAALISNDRVVQTITEDCEGDAAADRAIAGSAYSVADAMLAARSAK